MTLPPTKQNGGEEKDRTLTATYVEDENGRQIKLIFPDAYSLEADYTYTVTTPIEPTEKAYEKYRDGKETYPNTPDAGTGTHAENAENRENGFYCNDTAQLKYNNTKGDKTVAYDKPVIQLTPGKLVIQKTIAGELTEAQVEELKRNLSFKYTLNKGEEQSTKLTDWTQNTNGTYTASATVASGLSPNTEYTVTEANETVEGYVVDKKENGNSGIIGKGETKTASFTNTYTKATQNLTITKAVSGKDAAFDLNVSGIDYTFTITPGEDVTVKNGKYGNATFSNNKGTVTIRGENSVTIPGLPVGTYTVRENGGSDVPEGYDFDTNSTEMSGTATLTNKDAGSVTITNKYKIKELKVTVKKEVTGNMGDTNQEFSFNDGKFKLKDNGTKEFTVKYGEAFTVTETDADQNGYTTSYKVDDGDAKDGGTCAIDAIKADTTITFTNKKQINPPNGIITTIAPYAIMVVLAAGAGVYFVYSRRRRNG